MIIFYPLCLLTLFASILLLVPRIVKVDNKPILRKHTLIVYFICVALLYYLRHFEIFYYLAIIVCTLTTIAIFTIILFSIQDMILLKKSSLLIRFHAIDRMTSLDFEYFIAEVLSKRGFDNISVIKDAEDFGVNILCYKIEKNQKYAIQVKLHKTPLSGRSIQEVEAGAQFYNANHTIVITNSTFTPKAKILAKTNNCFLVDRYLLKRWILENENNFNYQNQKDKKKVAQTSVSKAITTSTINNSTVQYINFDEVAFTPELEDQEPSVQDNKSKLNLLNENLDMSVDKKEETLHAENNKNPPKNINTPTTLNEASIQNEVTTQDEELLKEDSQATNAFDVDCEVELLEECEIEAIEEPLPDHSLEINDMLNDHPENIKTVNVNFFEDL